ncbi:MAG: hypothetical protein KU37_05010 [Sulfuricurvum sp. PC08-66]|nr:MAG: hypothetical protein KU37_05010 [Sulfuricurvum sp. PC08-66]
MQKTEIQNDLEKLNQIKEMIDETQGTTSNTQDDSALVAFLESNYKLTAKAMKTILAAVEGKKPTTKEPKGSNKRTQRDICGECIKVGVNFNDKEGKFVGFDTLKQRIAQKKNQLSMKLKKM